MSGDRCKVLQIALNASSVHEHCPLVNYILNQPTGAWCAGTDDLNQWIVIDIGE